MLSTIDLAPPPTIDAFGGKSSPTAAAKAGRDKAVTGLGSVINQVSALIGQAEPIQAGLRQASAMEQAYRGQGDLAKLLEDAVVAAVFSRRAQDAFWDALRKSPAAKDRVDETVRSLQETLKRSQDAQAALKSISFTANSPAQLNQLKAQVEAAKSRAKQALSSAQSSISHAKEALHAGIELARSIRVVMKDVLKKAHWLTYQKDGDKRRSDVMRKAGAKLRSTVNSPKESIDHGIRQAKKMREELPKIAKSIKVMSDKIDAIKITGGSKNVIVTQPTSVGGDIVIGLGIGAALLVAVTVARAVKA